MNLLHWLKKTPQPVAVLADDKRIPVPRNARAYRDLLVTIQSMEPAKLTCLDAQDNVIRSVTLETEADDKPSASAEMSDLQLFAKLLAEGYEHGQKATQPLIDSAMQFVERQSVRLAKAEAEIERLRMHIHKLNGQLLEAAPESAADGGGGIVEAMVAGVLQAQAGGAAVTPLKTGVGVGVKK